MSFEEKVKISFEKVREEIWELKKDQILLKDELNELKGLTTQLTKIIQNLSDKTNLLTQSSSGNNGVPADRQTDRQTFDTPSFPIDGNSNKDLSLSPSFPAHSSTHVQHIPEKTQHFDTSFDKKPVKTPQIEDLTDLMESLKADLKKRFKTLTKQEFYIFSVLYTVERTDKNVTYSDLAAKTGLTSSSIRDYIQRIIQKGIPISKEKLNNKVTLLKILPELRNLATLDNLIRLRTDFKDQGLDRFTKP